MSEATTPTLEATVLRLWNEEPRFRAELLLDPRAALREFVGIEVAPTIGLHVHVANATDVHLVLPALPADDVTDADFAEIGAPTVAGTTYLGTWNLCRQCGRTA